MADAQAGQRLRAAEPMAPRRQMGMPVAVVASAGLHAAVAALAIFDFGLFGARLEEPPLAFAVGMVPLSELTAAPQVGEITPPRPLEVLEEPAGNEAREVDTVDAEAPEQAPSADPAPDSQAPEVTEAPPDIPAETPPDVATADTPPPPPALSEPPLPAPDAAQPDVAEPEVTAPEAVETAEAAPQPEVPPVEAAAPDPQADPATAPPQSPDSPQVAALEAPALPQVPQQPAERQDDPVPPPPPLPPDRTTQARVRPETAPEDEPEPEEDETPPVEAAAPPTEEPAPEPPQVAEITVPPPPALTPDRERAPERPTAPPPAVVDNTAPPPERPSAIDSVLASLNDSAAPNTGQGTGRDTGSGGSSGSGNAASGARLTGARLTLSEEEALRGQLARCWLLPSGAAGVENMTVTIRATMRPDRMVEGRAEIIDPQNRMASDPAFRAFAESAQRAVMMCQPLLLPQDRYADWSTLNLNFDPRSMF